MRRLALLATLAACDPEITSGVYYCGPERACPPDLRCDEPTALCVYPAEAEAFVCGPGTNDNEPDDDLASAFALGTAGCGSLSLVQPGALDEDEDVDHLAVVTPVGCAGEFEVLVRYPIALAAVTVEILDATGAVLATGEICDDLDVSGRVHLCAQVDVTPSTTYVLRIGLGGEGDCDGACAYNRYMLSVL